MHKQASDLTMFDSWFHRFPFFSWKQGGGGGGVNISHRLPEYTENMDLMWLNTQEYKEKVILLFSVMLREIYL